MSANHSDTYIIHGSLPGAKRLHALAEATWKGSSAFLTAAGVFKKKSRGLDMGCGNGAMMERILPLLHEGSELWGVDYDSEMIRLASENLIAVGYPSAANKLEVWDVEKSPNLPTAGTFDWILVRFLLSHLVDPMKALLRIKSMLNPGGYILIEDVDFEGNFSFPKNSAFDRYVEFYTAAAKSRGCDACIGPKLSEMSERANLLVDDLTVHLPVFRSGLGKQMALLTLEGIKNSIVSTGNATIEDCEAVSKQLAIFSNDPNSIISLPRIFQVKAMLR